MTEVKDCRLCIYKGSAECDTCTSNKEYADKYNDGESVTCSAEKCVYKRKNNTCWMKKGKGFVSECKDISLTY